MGNLDESRIERLMSTEIGTKTVAISVLRRCVRLGMAKSSNDKASEAIAKLWEYENYSKEQIKELLVKNLRWDESQADEIINAVCI